MPHIHDKYDYVVTAGIVCDGRVLLVRHRKLDEWLAPGGHIELSEQPLEALFREIEEEVGYQPDQLRMLSNEQRPRPIINDGEQLPPPLDIHIHKITDTHWHIALIYGFETSSPDFTHNPREHHETRWFGRRDIESIRDELLPNIYKHALFILDLADKQ
ncbi:MAG: NUDIX domain-containing protein [Candidatus Saccharimonadales bacterium]|nr:NUDIX domain-containing protein [Candidatus Saccharimonadales bacterium]